MSSLFFFLLLLIIKESISKTETQIVSKTINCKATSSYTCEFSSLSTGLILPGLNPGQSY